MITVIGMLLCVLLGYTVADIRYVYQRLKSNLELQRMTQQEVDIAQDIIRGRLADAFGCQPSDIEISMMNAQPQSTQFMN